MMKTLYQVMTIAMLLTVLGSCAGVAVKQQTAMEWLESEYRPGAR